MRDLSLRIKIPIFIALVSALLTFPLLIITNSQQVKTLESNFYKNQKMMLSLIILEANEALETGMYHDVQYRINQLSKRRDIFSIELKNSHHNIRASAYNLDGKSDTSMSENLYRDNQPTILGLASDPTDPKLFLGSIIIKFDDSEKERRLKTLEYQLWSFTLAIFLIIFLCIFGVNVLITNPIEIMGAALINIQKGIFHTKIPEFGKDEIGTLSTTILETGIEIERREQDKLQEHDKKISEYTEKSNQDIKKITRIRDILEDLRASARLSFELASIVLSQNDSKEANLILANALDSIASINNMQGIIEEEHITHRLFSSETLNNYAMLIDKTIEIIADTARFPIQLIIDKEITNSGRHILIDVKTTMRLLSLALEYWPKALETDDNPWFIAVSIEEKIGQEKMIMIEFTTNNASPHTLNSIAKKPRWELCDPILRKIQKLEDTDGIEQRLSIKNNSSVSIQYVCDYVDSESASGILDKYKQIFKFNRSIALLGQSSQLSSIGKRLEARHIDTRKATHDNPKTIKQMVDHSTGIILVDCQTSSEKLHTTMNLLSNLRAEYKFMIIGVVRPHELSDIEDGFFEIHEIMGFDDMISFPVSADEVDLLINSMSSDEIISEAIHFMRGARGSE